MEKSQQQMTSRMTQSRWAIQFLRRPELQFALASENRAPVLVIRDWHAALDAHAGALDRLVGLATKQLFQ